MSEENRMDEVSRRQMRRKRRVRNQVIAYVSLGVMLIALMVGGYLGIRYLSGNDDNKKVVSANEAEVSADEIPVVSEPEAVVETVDPKEQQLNDLVESYISKMTIEEKVAGLFMVTPESITGVSQAIKAGEGTKTALTSYPVGGIIYFSQNIQTEEQFKTMIETTKGFSKYPLFIGIDEEGGPVSRVANSDIAVTKVEAPAILGASGDSTKVTDAYTTIGSYLVNLGINVDFAPVSDVATTNNTMFAERAFGADASVVTTMVVAGVNGLQGQGVSACLKHFPGHGSTEGDSHEGLAVSNRTLDELKTTDYLPFKAGIDMGADFVMVGHISLPQVLGDNTPASLSYKMVSEELRNALGFQGVIVTDSMSMMAITEYYTSSEAAVQAINAGVDVILMPENFEEAYNGVLDAVKEGSITEERINESLRRIYRVKCEKEMVVSIE